MPSAYFTCPSKQISMCNNAGSKELLWSVCLEGCQPFWSGSDEIRLSKAVNSKRILMQLFLNRAKNHGGLWRIKLSIIAVRLWMFIKKDFCWTLYYFDIISPKSLGSVPSQRVSDRRHNEKFDRRWGTDRAPTHTTWQCTLAQCNLGTATHKSCNRLSHRGFSPYWLPAKSHFQLRLCMSRLF